MERSQIEAFYREDFGRVLATVVRLVGDLQLAEESVQDAFEVALARWPIDGTPENPRSWIISTARHKAIDVLRRAGRLAEIRDELRHTAPLADGPESAAAERDSVPDERLRLIFTCCHPAIALDAQVALALRTLCGLSTDEIARAFLVSAPTMAQRLVRAKNKISAARIPYEIPPPALLPERLHAVMTVVYLVFNEGYSASKGDALIRADLCREAIRLGRMLCDLLPAQPETRGLLALMLLHDARRETRTTDTGELVLLDEQDRSRWDRGQIEEGLALSRESMRAAAPGPYAVQAAIAAEHARAARASDTDWQRIATLYGALVDLQPTPVVELNRAVAVAMADGPAAGLALLDRLAGRGELDTYHLHWSARAELLRRLGRTEEAAICFRRALSLVTTDPERRFLERRLRELGAEA